MPFNYAHARFALAAAEATGYAASVIDQSPAAFRAGAMGPDPYFADKMPKPLFAPCRTELAGRMHEEDAERLFSAMLFSARSPAQRAYALGMLCHFLLDNHAHAYIYARFPGRLHTPGEMHMDLLFCDWTPHPALAASPSAFFRLTPQALDEIDALHAACVQSLYGEDSRGAFARSYRKWTGLVARATFDPHGRKRRLLARLEKEPGSLSGWLVTRDPADEARDLMNLRHDAWHAPWEPQRERHESFVELYEAALAEAPALLNAAARGFTDGDFHEAQSKLKGRCMNGSPLL